MTEGTKKAAITAIQKIAKTYGVDIVETISATVLSVDKSKRTCKVKPISGKSDTEIEDVNLMAERNDGEFKIPSVNSTVVVVMSYQTDPYIISWSDLDEWYLVIGNTTIDVINGEIKIGDGSFGGIVKIDDLKSQWDANVNATKAALIAAFTGIDAAISSLGGTSTSVATFNTQATNIKTLNKVTIENKTVKHGS